MSKINLRLRKEFQALRKKPCSDYIHIHGLVRENLQIWEVYLLGPPSTLYESGVYKAILKFPDDYPMKPPSLQFTTEMLHPNIYKDGKVCISTLQTGPEGKDASHYWRPVLGVEQALLSVVSLLSDPNLSDPANTAAANLFKNHRDDFEKRCKVLAAKSLKSLPQGFEFPRAHQEQIKKQEPVKKAIIEQDEDDYEYDIEDLSSDEDEDEVKDLPVDEEIENAVFKKDDDEGNAGDGFLDENTTGNDDKETEHDSKDNGQEEETKYQTSGENTNQARDAEIDLLEILEQKFLFPQEIPKKKKSFGGAIMMKLRKLKV